MTNHDVIKYVDAANKLAVSLKQDIKDGIEVSDKTLEALSGFIEAAKGLKDLSDAMEKEKAKMN